MDVRLRGGVLVLAALLAASGARAQALPEGVTPEMLTQGRKLFEGRGLCASCHGTKATGALGPNLTDAEWWHSDGSYPAIVHQIMHGVPAGQSRSGTPMPPKGGSSLSPTEVRAVAAYVHSLRTVTNAGAAGGSSGSVAVGAGGAGHQHRAGRGAAPGGGQGPGRGGECPAQGGGQRAGHGAGQGGGHGTGQGGGHGAGPGAGNGAGQCPMHGEGCPMKGSGASRESGPCRT